MNICSMDKKSQLGINLDQRKQPAIDFSHIIEGDFNASALRVAKSFLKNEGTELTGNLLLVGNSGMGKTMLLKALCTENQKSAPENKILYLPFHQFSALRVEGITILKI